MLTRKSAFFKLVYFICVLMTKIDDTFGDNNGNCHIYGISDEEWKTDKRYDPRLQTDNILYKYEFEEPLDVINGCEECLEVKPKGTELIINATSNIEELDNIIPPSPSFEIVCSLTFICKNGESSLVLVQPIIDVNQNPPVFYNNSYEILVPEVVPPNTDIVEYLKDPIKVEDGDFSNYNVTFEISSQSFKVDVKKIELDYKTIYVPVLQTIEYMTFDNQTYYLTATDSGNIPNNLSSTIKILVRQPTAADDTGDLYFSKSLYRFDYIKSGSNEATLLSSGNIILVSGPNEVIIYLQKDKMSPFFKVYYDKRTQMVDLVLLEMLPEEIRKRQEPIYLTLCAKYYNNELTICTSLEINVQ